MNECMIEDESLYLFLKALLFIFKCFVALGCISACDVSRAPTPLSPCHSSCLSPPSWPGPFSPTGGYLAPFPVLHCLNYGHFITSLQKW